jgi:hypothetical protein
VLVRYKGEMQPGVTLRDLVHAIPLYAIKAGLLTVAKAGKKNVFSGRILEIEGLPDLKVEQAFELSDASAERSAAQQTIIRTDPNAVVGSRMLLSLFNNNVPSCSDVNEMGLLSWMGYRNFLLCDDLCTSGPALHRAVDTFHSILP